MMISLEFVITSLVVVLVPGTGVIYTVSTALLRGRRAGIFASLGCTLGILPHLAATILGLAAVLHTSALAFQVMKFAGAFYLLYMAVVTWRDRTAFAVDADRAGAATSGGTQVLNAFVLNILNPKLTIFFLAYLPQFVDAGAGQPLAQLLNLSALFMAMTFAVFVVYVLVAHGLRRHVMGSARVQQGLRRGFSAAFAALGARLALSEH
jgi:threonine/homoserine/homoserine lactone efflux protein